MRTIVKKIFLFVALTLLILTNVGIVAYADSDNLDEIENYNITVNVREDGTLDIRYDVEWKVLSDKNGSEPVTWVKVGIPNSHCDSIEAITDNIESAKYYGSGGDFVRVDFTKKYYKGEVFTFSFTIHQSYMYMLEDDSIKYSFTAGWFEDIEVKNITIKWNKMWVAESTAKSVSEDGKYLVWKSQNLPEGDHFSTSVRYPSGTFSTDENKQYVERSSGGLSTKAIVIIVIVLVVLVLLLLWLDDYGGGSGFGGGYHSTFISSCAGCASCASCACACACAGGGRAGCSIKDTYRGHEGKIRYSGMTYTLFDEVLDRKISEK